MSLVTLITNFVTFDSGYPEKRIKTDFSRICICALMAALLLILLFIRWPQNITLATIDIVKKPMAVTIHWARVPSPSPINSALASDSVESIKNIIHQKSAKKSLPSLDSKKLLENYTNMTLNKAKVQDQHKPQKIELADIQPVEDLELTPKKENAHQKKKITDSDEINKANPIVPLNETESAQVESATSKGSQQAQSQLGHKPDYPRNAIRRQQEGRVLVELTVDELGETHDVQLISSSGYYLLDQSVLGFVKKERFNPATRNGKSVVSRQEFGFVFSLN